MRDWPELVSQSGLIPYFQNSCYVVNSFLKKKSLVASTVDNNVFYFHANNHFVGGL